MRITHVQMPAGVVMRSKLRGDRMIVQRSVEQPDSAVQLSAHDRVHDRRDLALQPAHRPHVLAADPRLKPGPRPQKASDVVDRRDLLIDQRDGALGVSIELHLCSLPR